MSRKMTKVVVLLVLLVIIGAGAYLGTQYYGMKDILVVQVGEAVRQDLAQTVASSGEIKPKKSVNISSNAMGRIIRMPVKEGDRVREGDLLISLESIQTAADVEAAQAMLEAGQTELDAMESQIRSNEAAIATAKADIAR
ncbi:MAG TPA: biotin/lipoyl-binding protein, partial [Terriglobia bacterium]|nr:biotin/lipoyl-binding protein [Terriglobia bacterium]